MEHGYGTIGELEIAYPVASTEIAPDVHQVRSPLWGPTDVTVQGTIYVGHLVLFSKDGLAVVDSGLAYHPKFYIIPYLESLGRGPKDVRLIISTHDHFDHVLGNPPLRELSGAEAAAHPGAADTIPGGVEHLLEDGDTLSWGKLEFEVLHTPGHSPTAICLWEQSRRLLICGDAVQGNGDISQGLPIIRDISAYRESLRRLLELDAECMVPAHQYRYASGPILRGAEIREHMLASLKWTEVYKAEIIRILDEAPAQLSRAELHARVVEAVGYHPEDAVMFATRFLSAWSRPTIEAYLSQEIPDDRLDKLSGASWPDVGVLAE